MASLRLDHPHDIGTDFFMPGADYDDVVVGAGLMGLVTACSSPRAGRRVAVLEARQVERVRPATPRRK
jgi:thioredoxin reductase